MNYSYSYSSSSSSHCRRKHHHSTIITATATLRRMFITHKKHFNHNYNYYSSNSSPVVVNFFSEGISKSDEVSARKLAAGLWQMRFMEEVSKDGSHHDKLANGNVNTMFPHYKISGEKIKKTKGLGRIPITLLRSRNGFQRELESSMPRLKCSKVEAKWDPALAEASNNEFTKIHSRKLHEDRKFVGNHDSVVTALIKELLVAQRSINKLKVAHKSSKEKVEHLLKNLEEENVRWKRGELKKIQATLDGLEDKLLRERRSRERMELLNTKLVHELAEANLYAKQFMTNYEIEKKERELTEKVCNQLAMQIEEDKAKLEGLLRVSMKLCEEVEEERKMMQMANLWREERAQMKLVDAKLVLEDKYNQMVQLIACLEIFLRSKGAELATTFESVNIQRIVELPYDFSKLEDILFPIYEDPTKDNAGPLSTIHIVSLDEEGLKKKSALHESSNSSETLFSVEHQKFMSSPQRRDPSLINVNHEKNMLGSEEAECNEKSAGLKSLKKWRVSHASKLLRPCPIVVGTTSSNYAKASQRKRTGKGSIDEGGFRHKELLGQRNSRDKMNPHITRGMKGCIEWPRGIPKANSKVIPMEERMRSQKSQLQNILKHKA
ncbi:hypothetical protein RIF29_40705 [Crotalaria pallida]|uniref:Uncharacterized protein n=1 Tax=Crotalaria pallida TaxID=3830 RepID=A0AAN9HUJ5_CROPI